MDISADPLWTDALNLTPEAHDLDHPHWCWCLPTITVEPWGLIIMCRYDQRAGFDV